MQTAWAGEGPAALAPFGSGHHWLFREPRSSTADLPDAGDPDVRVRHAKPPRSKPATLAAVWLAPHRWRLAPWYWRGLQVTLEPGSAIAWIVRLTGGFEETEIDIAAALYSALYPDRCILDVGANVGIHSLAWARLAPVVALEPAPGTHSRLEANVAANGLQDRIRTLRTAAGDAVGEVDFSWRPTAPSVR